jgi:hypothetical protein
MPIVREKIGEKLVEKIEIDVEIPVRQDLPDLRRSGAVEGEQAAARAQDTIGGPGYR